MEILNINAQIRTNQDSSKMIREEKKLAWIIYWKHQDNISIKLDYSEFLKLYRKVGDSTIFTINIDWKNIEVLVHEKQKDPVSGDFIHVDFFAITKWEKLHAKIHLNFINSAPIARQWAIIEELIKEIEVVCLPKDLINHFDVDLSSLEEFNSYIKISDLTIDREKFSILDSQDEIVVLAWKPAKAESETEENKKETETK